VVKLVTIKVPEGLRDEIKVYAAANKLSMFEVVESAFRKLSN